MTVTMFIIATQSLVKFSTIFLSLGTLSISSFSSLYPIPSEVQENRILSLRSPQENSAYLMSNKIYFSGREQTKAPVFSKKKKIESSLYPSFQITNPQLLLPNNIYITNKKENSHENNKSKNSNNAAKKMLMMNIISEKPVYCNNVLHYLEKIQQKTSLINTHRQKLPNKICVIAIGDSSSKWLSINYQKQDKHCVAFVSLKRLFEMNEKTKKHVVPLFHIQTRFHYEYIFASRYSNKITYSQYSLLEEALSDIMIQCINDTRPQFFYIFVFGDPIWMNDDSVVSYFTRNELQQMKRYQLIDLENKENVVLRSSRDNIVSFFIFDERLHPFL